MPPKMTFSLPEGWAVCVKLSARLGAAAGAEAGGGTDGGWRAERNALTTSCVQ